MPGKENVQGFADALKAATDTLSQSVDKLAVLEREVAVEAETAKYLEAKSSPSTAPGLPEEPSAETPNADLAQWRLGDVMRMVAAYAKRLSEMAGGGPVTATQESITAARVRAEGAAKELGAQVSAETTQVVGAFEALAKIAIETQTASAVRRAIATADPDIKKVSQFVIQDVVEAKGRGMAEAYERKLQRAIRYQLASLSHIRADRSVNTFQRNQAFREASARIRAWQALAAVPGGLKDAMSKMEAAHHALLEPESASLQLEDLRRSVNRLADLYDAALAAGK